MEDEKISAEQHRHLQEMALAMRKRAEPVGPLHSLWDVIFDIEAVLAGKPPFLDMTIEERIASAEKYSGR